MHGGHEPSGPHVITSVKQSRRQPEEEYDVEQFFGSVRSLRYAYVRLSGEKCSRALNLHLSLAGQFQVSLIGLSELNSKVRRSLKYFIFFALD